MGKVQSFFGNGYQGAVSRSVDNVIISKRNSANAAIPFGTPVFLDANTSGVVPFASGMEASRFLGFTVRVASKTPDTYGSSEGQFGDSDPVEVLVRGAMALPVATSGAKPGDSLFIRLSDNKLVTNAGAEGTTFQIPNAAVSAARDENGFCEVLLKTRNLL